MQLRVGVAWCSSFSRRFPQSLSYRRLRYAYRAPSLFLQGMLQAGAEVVLVELDEELSRTDLDASGRRIDLLYVTTHGMAPDTGYELALHDADWRLSGSTFGKNGPVVAIFDTCHLVDPRTPQWLDPWRSADLGPALRLVLGFSTPAGIGEAPSVRGAAFAAEAMRMPFTDAWFVSIQHGSYPGTDRPVALAFGDDDADAERVLREASIYNLPPPRASDTPVIKWALG